MGQVYILGAGTPTPTPTRFGSAHVIEVAGDYLMFVCGPAATYKLVKAGTSPKFPRSSSLWRCQRRCRKRDTAGELFNSRRVACSVFEKPRSASW
jgi:ribonuclease BN (tRNA processing enzyme)